VIHSDEALLRRILQNYLSNAVRYSRRGRVLMGCRRVGASLRIEVWDTGPGIAPEHHRRIFLEFQRLDSGGQSAERGAGLGLAIVERVAKRLGHRIGLRSWVGRGSVFFVEVPWVKAAATNEEVTLQQSQPKPQLQPRPSRAEPRGTRDPGAPLNGSRIWSVEDDPRVRQSIQTLLTGWGCQVTLASSREEALRLVEQSPTAPDLLLLDYRLPDGNGPEVVPELFRKWSAEVPVIVISAEQDAAVRERVQASGWGFLAKPVNPSKLRAAVTHMLMKSTAPV
jgi:histidine kinase